MSNTPRAYGPLTADLAGSISLQDLRGKNVAAFLGLSDELWSKALAVISPDKQTVTRDGVKAALLTSCRRVLAQRSTDRFPKILVPQTTACAQRGFGLGLTYPRDELVATGSNIGPRLKAVLAKR